jgi:hypothetical protein
MVRSFRIFGDDDASVLVALDVFQVDPGRW